MGKEIVAAVAAPSGARARVRRLLSMWFAALGTVNVLTNTALHIRKIIFLTVHYK